MHSNVHPVDPPDSVSATDAPANGLHYRSLNRSAPDPGADRVLRSRPPDNELDDQIHEGEDDINHITASATAKTYGRCEI